MPDTPTTGQVFSGTDPAALDQEYRAAGYAPGDTPEWEPSRRRQRTDVHRPAVLVPEDYDFRGVIDLQAGSDYADLGALAAARQLREQLFVVEGRTHASIHPHGQCDHCGAYIRYAAYLVHRPTGKVLTVGETCLDNRFERTSEEFHRARRAAELDRGVQRIKAELRRFAADPANADIAWMADRTATPPTDNEFVVDVAHRLRAYGSISQPQVDAVRAALARDAEREAERADEPTPVAIPTELVGTRVTLEATVLGISWREGGYGGAWKALLQVPHGDGAYKVWSTVPASVLADIAGRSGADQHPHSLRGQVVRWTGTLVLGGGRFGAEPDPTFGILKRPREAT
jgi:hypothetical protein